MKTKNLQLALLGVILLLALSIQPGCKKDHGDSPQIPPSSSFVMNFSDLDSSKAGGKFFAKMAVDSIGEYSNYIYSAGNVFVWNIIINVGLAVPVASFLNSFNYQAQWDNSSNVWAWNYNFTVGISYSAKLTAKVAGNQVHWEMFISKQNAYQDFLWYMGDSYIDGTQGTWTLYDNPVSNKELIGILWHKDVNNGTSDIKYTNIVPGDPENGGYIAYGITTDATYNAYYDIFNKGQNNHTNILWNTTSKNGHVSDHLHFGDTDWHCWDVDYKNIVCQ